MMMLWLLLLVSLLIDEGLEIFFVKVDGFGLDMIFFSLDDGVVCSYLAVFKHLYTYIHIHTFD